MKSAGKKPATENDRQKKLITENGRQKYLLLKSAGKKYLWLLKTAGKDERKKTPNAPYVSHRKTLPLCEINVNYIRPKYIVPPNLINSTP